jgi:hypothetical protein
MVDLTTSKKQMRDTDQPRQNEHAGPPVHRYVFSILRKNIIGRHGRYRRRQRRKYYSGSSKNSKIGHCQWLGQRHERVQIFFLN